MITLIQSTHFQILIPFLIFIQISKSDDFSSVQGNNCIDQLTVVDFYEKYYPSTLSQKTNKICIECQESYVVSYDLQSCLHYKTLPSDDYYFCKRLDKQNKCEEAQCGVQLNEKGQYTPQNEGNQNCAIFSTLSGKCLRPRLGYSLDIQSQKITKDVMQFCALKMLGNCIEYFSVFLPYLHYSVFIFNFTNPHLIDKQQSIISSQLLCEEDSDLILDSVQTNKYYGCVKKNYQIQNCLTYDQVTRLCTKCEDGYSLNINQKQCSKILNCQSHTEVRKIQTCIICSPMNYLKENECTFITNCVIQQKINQYCSQCKYPYYGKLCEQVLSQDITHCKLLNLRGSCSECEDNELYYFDLRQKKCLQRQLSNHCVKKNSISDQCDDFRCKDGFIFNVSLLQLKIQDFSYKNYTCNYLQYLQSEKDKMWLYGYDPDMNIYYEMNSDAINDLFYIQQRQSILEMNSFCIQRVSIPGCIEYETCFQSCLKCDKGYYLEQRQDQFTNFFYRFHCLKIIGLPTLIENCLEYNELETICIQCANNYSSYGGSCKLGSVDHCQVYSYNNICSQCQSNYILFNQVCFNIEFCEKYELVQDFNVICTKCFEFPFDQISLVELSNGKRKQCIQNTLGSQCSHYVDDTCISCFQGYVLIQGMNLCVSENQVTENCFIADQSSKCLSCISDFKLVNEKCVKLGGQCSLRYNCDNKLCQYQCVGFNVNSSSQCQYYCDEQSISQDMNCYPCNSPDLFGQGCILCSSDQFCDQCNLGYIWNQDKKKCMFLCSDNTLAFSIDTCPPVNCNIPFCQKCDETNGNCLNCFDSRWLLDNQCLSDCSPEYQQISFNDKFNRYCYKCKDGCEKCVFNNLYDFPCILCKEGYYLTKENECVKDCEGFIQDNKCLDICVNFVLPNQQCVEQCPDNYFIKTVGEGSLLETKYCISSCPDNFFKYKDVIQLCTEICLPGYFPDRSNKLDYQCQKCQVEHCSDCIQDINICNNCISGYLLENNSCKIICPSTLTLPNSILNCPKCSYLGCQADCDFQGVCSKCADNYIIDESGRCICSIEKGFIIEYSGRCIKCNVPQCIKCQKLDFCIQCEEGYKLQYILKTGDKQKIIETQFCVKECSERQYEKYNQCLDCVQNCMACNTKEDCTKCDEGYSLIIIPKQDENGTVQQGVACLYQCPDGSYKQNPQQCSCYDINCKDCSKNLYSCQSCKDNYTLNSYTNYCEIISNCKTSIQLSTTDWICKLCFEGYLNVNGVCYYKCKNGSFANKPSDCSQYTNCFVQGCVLCSSKDPYTCLSCSIQNPFLINGKCYDKCPDGNYLNLSIPMKCERCQNQCKTCNSPSQCQSCLNPNTSLIDNCLCPQGQYLYKQRCIQKCPFYSTQIKNICLEYCVNGMYPIQNSQNKESFLCQVVQDSSSLFCIQNLQNLQDTINISFAYQDNGMLLAVTLYQTPSVCYKVILKGKNNKEINGQLKLDNMTDDSIYIVQLPPSSEMDQYYNCDDEINCHSSIEVFLNEVLQYQLSFQMQLNLNIIVTTKYEYSSSTVTYEGVICQTCNIPVEQIINSTFEVSCLQGCSNGEIIVSTNEEVYVTQKISEEKYNKNKVLPHSLNLEYVNSKGILVSLFITNYFFDNTIKGQITYKFSAIALQSGNLVITSIINSSSTNFSQNNNRLLQEKGNKSNGINYPQIKIPITIKDTQIAQNQANLSNQSNKSITVSNTSAIVISICVGTGVFAIIISIIIYKKCSKRKQQQSDPHTILTRKSSDDKIVLHDQNDQEPNGQSKVVDHMNELNI